MEKMIFKGLHYIFYIQILFALAINSPIIYVAPPFEQTLITHNQELFVCNI